MSTTEATEVAEDAHHDGEHMTDRSYIVIAIVLAIITLVEVATYFWDFGDAAVPLLLVLMVAKFAIVVAFFMHLKFDNRLFTYLFVSGVLLAAGVYIVLLLAFNFWSGDIR